MLRKLHPFRTWGYSPMLQIKLFIVLFLGFLPLRAQTPSLTTGINNAKFRVEMGSSSFKACSGQGITIMRVQSKIASATNFKITFTLPTGVAYDGGLTLVQQTGSGDFTVTEADVSDPSHPEISIQRSGNAPWKIGDVVEFSFLKTAGCDAVQYSYSGGLFKDKHTISFTDAQGLQSASDTDPTVNSYNLLRPFLAVNALPTVELSSNQVVNRNVTVVNSGNGSLSVFEHQVLVPTRMQAAYQLSFNGTVLVPSNITGSVYTYTIDLNAAPFAGNVGDGDNLFENESIVFSERLSATGCDFHEKVYHAPRWGCGGGQICQYATTIIRHVDYKPEAPNLEMAIVNNPTPDFGGPVTYTTSITNTSSTDNAYNVAINIGFGDVPSNGEYNALYGDDVTMRSLDNFHFTGGPVLTAQRYPQTTSPMGLGSHIIPPNYLTFDPDGPGGLSDLDGDGYFDDLAPSATTQMNVDLTLDPIASSCSPDARTLIDEAALQMDSWALSTCNGSSTTYDSQPLKNAGLSTQFFFNFNTPQSFEADFEGGKPYVLNLSGTLLVQGNAPTCNGVGMFANSSGSDIRSYTMTITVPDGVTLSPSASAKYAQSGNQITFTETRLAGLYNTINNELIVPSAFPLLLDCASYTGPKDLEIFYTDSYSNSCTAFDINCGSFFLTAHCDDGCSGPRTTSFTADRVTPGWTDETMTTKVTLDPSQHNLKYYMPRDKMKVTASNVMKNDVRDDLFFDLHFITENDGSVPGDVIQFLSGTITIKDLSSSTKSTAITVQPQLTSTGNDHHLVFDLSSYRSIISPTYQYGEGNQEDQISLELEFQFADTFPKQFYLHQFYTFEGSFYGMDGSGPVQECDSYSDRAYFFQDLARAYKKPFINSSLCNVVTASASMEVNSGFPDKFPNEFRPTTIWKSTVFEIPDGYVYNGRVYGVGFPSTSYVPDSDNGGFTVVESGNTITVTPGPILLQKDQGSNQDISVVLEMLPTSEVPATTPFNWTVNYDKFASSDNPVPVSDALSTPLISRAGTFSLTADNQTESGNKKQETFFLHFCNENPGAPIANNWLRVDTADFIVEQAFWDDGGTANALNIVEENGLYIVQLGTMGQECRDIRLVGSYTGNANKEVKVSHYFDCVDYPTSYAGLNYLDEITLRLDPVEAAIQLNILDQPTASVDMCSDFDVLLEVRNAGEGDLFDPKVTFTVPGGITALDLSSINVEYPQSSGNIEALTPQINGDQVTIDLLEHSAIKAQNAILGSQAAATIAEQIAMVTFTMSPTCNFRSNTGITYVATGTSPSGEPALGNGSKLATNPIVITGAEPPYSTNSIASSTAVIAGCDTGTISVQTVIISGTTGTADFTRIILPQGLTYVPGSLVSTGTATVTFNSTNSTGTAEEVIFNLPVGATDTDTINYSFDVASGHEICEGDYDIALETYVTTNGLSCNGSSCGTTEIFTGGAETSVGIEKGYLIKSPEMASATYFNDGSSTHYDIHYGIQNIGNVPLDASTAFQVYCADTNGNQQGSPIYEGTLSGPLAPGVFYEEDLSFDTTQSCNANGDVVVVFQPSNVNCFCEPLMIPIAGTLNGDFANLSLDKAADNRTPSTGDRVTFTITLTNQGPLMATNVGVEDQVPSGYTVDTASISQNGVFANNTITWTFAQVPVGQTQISYVAVVNTPTGTPGEYTNVAQVTASDQDDPNSTPNNDDGDQSEDDEDSETLTDVTLSADISMSKAIQNIGDAPFNIGDYVTFGITLKNDGPADATGLIVEDYLPTGMELMDGSISHGGTLSGNTIRWNIPNLPAGSLMVTYTARLLVPTGASAEYRNTAQLVASDQVDPDSTPNNFNGVDVVEDDEAAWEMELPSTDLSLDKQVFPTVAKAGEQVTFVVTITNEGPLMATNIAVDEKLRSGFTFVSADATEGDYNEASGVWEIDSLGDAQTATLTIVALVNESGDHTNVATLSYVDQLDEDEGNDEGTAEVELDKDCLTVFNEFSPNNDGANDFFYVECIGYYPNNHLQVFNRWGVQVYEATGYNNDWDGSSQARATLNTASKLPVGTYYYILDLDGTGNTMLTGWIYLTR